jgi:transposase
MSENEMKKLLVLRRVGQGSLSLEQASVIIGLSYRHMRRIWKRYYEEGEKGLVHRNSGRPSNRAYLEQFKLEILRKYRQSYVGLGPTRFAERLCLEGIEIDHETIRRWLLESGFWKRSLCRHVQRPSNRRSAIFGEMLTLIAIEGRWLGTNERPNQLCVLYDEATRVSLFSLECNATSEAAILLLWSWVNKHGIPEAVRCPKRFFLGERRNLTLDQQLAGTEPRTQFFTVCERLGIDLNPFQAPEARRILSNLKSLADTTDCELKRGRPAGFEGANALLVGSLGNKLNSLFATCPDPLSDCHVPIVDGTDLRKVFALGQDFPVFRQMDMTISV